MGRYGLVEHFRQRLHCRRVRPAGVLLLSDGATVKWTKTVPTVEGLYWWREDPKSKAEVLKLVKRTIAGPLWVEVLGSDRVTEAHPVSSWAQGQWLGPIQPEEK